MPAREPAIAARAGTRQWVLLRTGSWWLYERTTGDCYVTVAAAWPEPGGWKALYRMAQDEYEEARYRNLPELRAWLSTRFGPAQRPGGWE